MREEDQRRTGFSRGQEATELYIRVVKKASVACYERENRFHNSNWSKSVLYRHRRRSSPNSRALPCLQSEADHR